ncbi:SemiSWEET transporter [Photobacterium nomapromontoriensis]|uniref:SemiSWEET transporter n=1 Tax=Photobacterium nomapromontoriensis TaxID=2910237 RepID=UPI003D11ADA2
MKMFSLNVMVAISVCLVGFPFLLENPTLLGSLAAACTTLSFLPQVIHTIKTKDTTGISLAMYIMFVFGVFSWLVYGYISNDLPLMLGNGITLILSSVVLYLKLKHSINSNSQVEYDL